MTDPSVMGQADAKGVELLATTDRGSRCSLPAAERGRWTDNVNQHGGRAGR
jgi:hypothetical protein